MFVLPASSPTMFKVGIGLPSAKKVVARSCRTALGPDSFPAIGPLAISGD